MLKRWLGSFRLRVLLGLAGLWAVLFGLAAFATYSAVRVELERSVAVPLVAAARWLAAEAAPLLPRGAQVEPGQQAPPALRAVLQRAREQGLAENVVLYSAKGLVLADASGEAVPGFRVKGLSPQEWQALSGGQPLVQAPRAGAFGSLHQSVFAPLGGGAVLELQADPRHLEVLNRYRQLSLWAGLIGVLLSSLVGALAAGWVLRPLLWMAGAAEGAGAPRGSLDRDDELARTAQAVAGQLDRLAAEGMEARLRREAAEQRARDLRQVASAIAHEVRNPLGVIRGQADLLQRQVADPKAAPLLQRVREQVDQLDSVVSRFLELSRAPRLEPRRIDAAELLQRLAEGLQPSLPSPAHKLQVLAAAEAQLDADPVLLEGALLNLALNGLQAMPQGGTLTLALRRQEPWLLISVQDQGPGLSPEVLARLGEPFFTTKPAGSGLGVALVRRAAEAHGGSLDAFNSPEGGAVFVLRLPLG